MPSGAKLSVFALLAVTALGWAMVALTPTADRPAVTAVAAEREQALSAVEPEAVSPGPTTRPAAPEAKAEPATAIVKPPTPPAAEPVPDPFHPERDAVEPEVDPIAEEVAAEERRVELNAQRYDEAHTRFATESRDDSWATEHEASLRALAEESGAADLLDTLECRSSMCQLRMRFDGLTTGAVAGRLGPLANAVGPDRVLRNEGPPDQRVMVIYVPRDGWGGQAAEGAPDGK